MTTLPRAVWVALFHGKRELLTERVRVNLPNEGAHIEWPKETGFATRIAYYSANDSEKPLYDERAIVNSSDDAYWVSVQLNLERIYNVLSIEIPKPGEVWEWVDERGVVLSSDGSTAQVKEPNGEVQKVSIEAMLEGRKVGDFAPQIDSVWINRDDREYYRVVEVRRDPGHHVIMLRSEKPIWDAEEQRNVTETVWVGLQDLYLDYRPLEKLTSWERILYLDDAPVDENASED